MQQKLSIERRENQKSAVTASVCLEMRDEIFAFEKRDLIEIGCLEERPQGSGGTAPPV